MAPEPEPEVAPPLPQPPSALPPPEVRPPIEEVIAAYWPYDDAWAIRCTRSESRGYRDFTGKAGEKGPFMIHPMHARNGLLQRLGIAWDDMPTDAANWTVRQIELNTKVAVALYDERGKRPWHAPGCR